MHRTVSPRLFDFANATNVISKEKKGIAMNETKNGIEISIEIEELESKTAPSGLAALD